MQRFIRIGERYISLHHIVEIHVNTIDNMGRHIVRIVTDEMVVEGVGSDAWVASSAWIDYEHGTPQAGAIIAWVASQAEVLV
jgi:hypothetical protein